MYENNANNNSQIIVGKLIGITPYYGQDVLHLWFGEEEYSSTDALFGKYDRNEDHSNLNPCRIYIQPETAGRDELLEEYYPGCLVAVKGEAYCVIDKTYGCPDMVSIPRMFA